MNKVLTGIMLALICVAGLSYVGKHFIDVQKTSDSTATTTPPDTAITVTTHIDQRTHVFELNITPKHIEDSRCPRDVFCVWAGTLSVTALVAQDGNSSGQTEQRFSIGVPVKMSGYSVTLIDATPYPRGAHAADVLTAGEYAIMFRVVKDEVFTNRYF